MSIKAVPDRRRSQKRRKLGHDFTNDRVDVSHNILTSGVSSASSNDEDISGDRSETEPVARRGAKRTNRKSSQALTSRDTVLPTGGISQSSILALQLAELNDEIIPNYERIRPKWTTLSTKLVALIKSTPERSPVTAVEATKSLRERGIRIPFSQPEPTKETNYKFAFKAPKQVLVSGALSQGLSLKNENVVDIIAIMPEDILQEKDYLNSRAPHKAAFYLACIAAAIKEEAAQDFELSFAHLHDVDLLPIISLLPKDTSFLGSQVNIAVGFPSDSIPIAKTLPTSNCLRQTTSNGSTQAGQPTPFYNSAVRYASSIPDFERLVQAAKSPSFDEACRVAQIWFRQRGFSSSARSGGFGYVEWSLICALLFQGGGHQGRSLFSTQYSSLQLFKAMLQVLGWTRLDGTTYAYQQREVRAFKTRRACTLRWSNRCQCLVQDDFPVLLFSPAPCSNLSGYNQLEKPGEL